MKRLQLSLGAAAVVASLAYGGLSAEVSTGLPGPEFTAAPPEVTQSPSPMPSVPVLPVPTLPVPSPTPTESPTEGPTPEPTPTPTSPAPEPEQPATAYDALVALDASHDDWTGPDVLTTLARVRVNKNAPDAVNANVATARVILPHNPEDPISVSRGGRDLSVNLPHAATGGQAAEAAVGIVEYPNTAGFSSFPIVRDDASIRLTTVIMEPDAPLEYSYDMGGDISFVMPTSDGYAVFDNGEGAYTGAVVPSWAFDAKGSPVRTRYETRGNVLTHVIDHTDETIEYPVVADAHMGEGLINRVDRSMAEGARRYHVRPSTWGIAVARDFGEGVLDMPLRGSYAMRTFMWEEALKKGTGDTVSVKQQFDCHALIAPLKHSWNLEAFRPPNDNWREQNSGCNWW